MKPDSVSASGFSLAALFFLMACMAVLMAVLLPGVQTLGEPQVGKMQFVASSLVVGAFASLLGGTVGLFHYRRLRGLGWGLLTGLVVGLCVGPVVLSRHFEQVVIACLGGSILLLILATVYRLQQP